MGAFEFRQAQEIHGAFERNGVDYLFLGKSGMILLGFPDTTQDADISLRKAPQNDKAILTALRELGLSIDANQAADIERCKDFIQLKNGPFDLDLIFAPDGIERLDDAWSRHINVDGFPVCHPDNIASKAAANRVKDRESLPRLRSFRDYWIKKDPWRA